MSIFAPDIPGVAENNTPILNPYMAGLESYVQVESKPYMKPAAVVETPHRYWNWDGYRNVNLLHYGLTNAYALIVPKFKIAPNVGNAQAPHQVGQSPSIVGQAPIKGIFTGVSDEVTPCH